MPGVITLTDDVLPGTISGDAPVVLVAKQKSCEKSSGCHAETLDSRDGF
jgi:hypothetical protein